MKHVRVMSKAPVRASNDIPVDDIITFVTSILTAIAGLITAKETTA